MNPFFTSHPAFKRAYQGPLGPHIDSYADFLHKEGYARQTACLKLRLIADFSRWLYRHRLSAEAITPWRIDLYLRERWKRRRPRRDDAAAPNQLVEQLRQRGIIHTTVETPTLSPRQHIEKDYRRYLLEERCLSTAACVNYLPFVSKFLVEKFATKPFRFTSIGARDVTGFVQRHASGLTRKRAGLMLTALRSFFRYLLQRGDIQRDLATCVPSVATWKYSSLPKFLEPEQVRRALHHCNRQTAKGRRDYAILLLLARLGVRACEIVSLTLDDIHWETGEITLRGKGARLARLPLPQDVGRAIAMYVKKGRPRCSTRRLFIRDRAPRRGFANSGAVGTVVARTLKAAHVHSPPMGAHVFRHTLATQMLRQGASLTEIGQLLRHRHIDTTTLYAKVDVSALKTLAQPWPGGAI